MYSNKSLRIFIVDEDPMIRELYKQYLLNMGFNLVEAFENGWKCFDQLHKKPDIIFVDYDVPPLDGIDILKKIKRMYPSIFLVFTTSVNNRQLIDSALKFGAFDFILKNELDETSIANVVNKISSSINSIQSPSKNLMNNIMNIF